MNTGSAGEGSQDFDLNLAPIIDCFTVLITFMLVSASFISIGLLDAGIAAAGATAAQNDTPPPINIAIELTGNHELVVKVSGKATSNTPIHAKADAYDLEAMSANLAALKQRWPGVNAVTLSADNAIEYRDVIKTMEVARKSLPVVVLGGF